MSTQLKKRKSDAGFTLIEMLVALAIFSLLTVGATTAMIAALQTKARVDVAANEITSMETARALLRADIDNIILRPARDPFGNQELFLISGGVDTLLTFTRGGRENPGGLEPRGGIQRVSYVFEDSKLIRRSFTVDNPAPQTQERDRVLLENIDDVEVSFAQGRLTFNQMFIPYDQPEVSFDLFVMTIRFAGGLELVQKFELDPT